MKKVIIIGSGVSGLVSAINIKNNNNEVLVLEKNQVPGKKILITGNGRCNFLNDDFTKEHFHSVLNNDISKIITLENKLRVLTFIRSLGIETKMKNGYYYPFTNKANTVRDALYEEAVKLGVEFKFEYEVFDIKKTGDKFKINADLTCDILIMSSGGKAYPKTGSDGSSYILLEKLGHTVTDLYPSLVQLETEDKYLKELDGVRTDAIVGIYDSDKLIKSETGELQFTSYGVSGICVFNLSRYANIIDNPIIRINLMPYTKDYKNYILNLKDNKIYEVLKRIVNEKIASVILKLIGVPKDKLKSELSENELNNLIDQLTSFKLEVFGTKSFDNSQVTMGGVDVNEINIETFESKIVSNLFLEGELLDVDGDCGGYNISFAIISALIASDRIKELCLE